MAIDPNVSKYEQIDLEEIIKRQQRLDAQKEESKRRAAFRVGYFKKIMEHVHLVNSYVDDEKGLIVILGVDCTWAIDIEEDRSGSDVWRLGKGTGRYSIKVAEESSRYDRRAGRTFATEKRKRFPQRKDGSHDYAEIALLLIKWAERRIASSEGEAARKANIVPVNAMRVQLKLNRYDSTMSVNPSSNPKHPYHVTIKVNAIMNPVQIQALHAALVKLGLVKEEADTSRCVSDY